jgi:hypothetical protein
MTPYVRPLTSLRTRLTLVVTAAAVAVGAATWAPSASGAAVLNVRTQNVIGTPNPCNGDFVTFTAHVHVLFTGDPSNLALQHLNVEGSGVGDPSGMKYQFSQVQNENAIVTSGDGADHIKLVLSENIVSQGDSPNFALRFVEQITVTPNGDVTAIVSDVSALCRG